jgi:hypothetical protein
MFWQTHINMVFLAIRSKYEILCILINDALRQFLISLDSSLGPPVGQFASLVELAAYLIGVIISFWM